MVHLCNTLDRDLLRGRGVNEARVIPNTYRMYEKLLSREYPSLQVSAEVLDGETHMTSINPFVIRGLRAVGFAKRN